MRAPDGNNVLDGGNGDDRLTAGNGNNTLTGGNGDDRFAVGAGNNILTGGNGDDTFTFGPNFGIDVISDFRQGDRIEFTGGVFTSFQAVQAAMHQTGSDTVISLDADHAITLQHIALASLHTNDFLLH